MRRSVSVCAFTPASRSFIERLAVGGRDEGSGSRRGDGGAERGGEPLGLDGRVGADPLHRDAVRARELADDARVLRVEAAAEARRGRRRSGR